MEIRRIRNGATLLWSPSSWQGMDSVSIDYAVWYGGMAGVNLVREFYPGVVRHYRHKGEAKALSASTAPGE